MADGGWGAGVNERALLDALRHGPILVVLLEPEGRVVSLNPACVEAWGLNPREPVVGRPVWEVIGRPDARGPILRLMEAVREEGRGFSHRSSWRRPDGEEIFTQWHGGFLPGGDGQRAHFYGLGVDVTGQERDARALAESEERFRWLASVTTEGIAIHDRGRLLDVNRRCRELFGLPPDAPLPRDIRPFFTESSWEAARRALAADLEEPYEVTGRRVDGEELPLEVTGRSLELRGCRVRVAAIRDLTWQKAAAAERERFEAGARRARRLETLGVLAGGLAHDFNNLLGLIVSYTDLAVDALPPDSPARAELEEVLDAARRASQITQRLLLVRPEGPPPGEVVSLHESAVSVHRLVARSFAPRVSVRTVQGPGTPRARVASARLEQALVNLLFNAREAIEGEGSVTLTTEVVTLRAPVPAVGEAVPPGRWAVVRVADTGSGLAPEVLDRAFEPFYTTRAVGRGSGGVGLGLAMVYGTVKEVGGYIQVDTAPGRGAVFSLLFPAVDGGGEVHGDDAVGAQVRGGGALARRPAGHEPHQPPGGGDAVRDVGRGRTVLVVDDNGAILAVTARILRRAGYRVLGAESAVEARHRWARASVDLLLTDVLMPGVSGPELARELQGLDPGLRVLFMSGHTRDALDGACRGHALLGKPFRAQKLLAAVAEALGLPG